MSTAFDTSQPRTFNLPPAPIDPVFQSYTPIEPPEDQFNKRLTRYIYYPLDRVSPERKNEMEHMVEGGDDVNSVCMLRTRGFLPKGKLTPLEIGYYFMAPDNLVDGQRERVEIVTKAPPGAEHAPPGLALVGLPHFPGPEATNLLGRWRSDHGIAMGHTDISELLGVPWESGEVQKLNALFAPHLATLNGKSTTIAAATLKGIEHDIERAAASVQDQTVKDIANKMLRSCLLVRRWSERFINAANRALVDDKFPQPYTSVDELILAQLELPRQDRVLQNQADEAREMKQMMSAIAEQTIAANQRPQMSQEDMMKFFMANQAEILKGVAQIMADSNKPQPPNNQNRK